MQYAVDSGTFDSLWYFLLINFSQTAVSLLLYGVYCILFVLSLYTLSRRKALGTTLLIVASCTMAVVASTQMALDIAVTVEAARLLQKTVHSEILNEHGMLMLLPVQNLMFAINTWVAAAQPLYRCYVIWGFRKKPLILPTLLILATINFFTLFDLPACSRDDIERKTSALILGAATNLVLTALTAGRILWIHRAASYVALDRIIRRRYTRAIVIILESGAVYCVVAIILVISTILADDEVGSITFGIAQQLLNIIPTFTLVYIGLTNMGDSRPTDIEIGSQSFSASSRSVAHTVQLHRRSSWPVLGIKMEETESE
ncbi:hypothetical protein B0H12DRAFT_1123059 [Mycena haematopus]|nr:hypothetical protein B0H12DRAFT_1123059 [Mycena haematopus]